MVSCIRAQQLTVNYIYLWETPINNDKSVSKPTAVILETLIKI